MANTRIKPGLGKRMVDGKSFRLAGEVRYIQRRAADHTGRVISIGQLILFSTKTGDAWLLDPSDQLAARLARDGDPEPIHIEETDTTFAIGWKGHYRIEGPACWGETCRRLILCWGIGSPRRAASCLRRRQASANRCSRSRSACAPRPACRS